MSFLKWLKNSGGSSLYLHEDFYCQVELIPIENFLDLKEENEKIDEFAKEHRDGLGFTDVYVRDGQKVKTSEREIPINEFEALLQTCGFQKVDKVYSGYGSHKEVCISTWGFKLDSSAVFCDFKNNLIENIWIDGFRFSKDSANKEELINCLFQIGAKWKLILNDWDLTEAIDLSTKKSIDDYISEE
ncbi:hypothetical protein C9994_03585 [Marivirga lumbricoides]|uniref:Uncharacterized protein n=1 Tax=Marivirga lumbricoides TaxID=1046115 RepID=A0A2T4DTV8_9BACT|nr:hypothetical protein C9994_03585 [Marivirga lumbricoides]